MKAKTKQRKPYITKKKTLHLFEINKFHMKRKLLKNGIKDAIISYNNLIKGICLVI